MGKLYWNISEKAKFTALKYGCDNGECGACTVLVDGKAQNACLMLIHSVEGCTIETIESYPENENLQNLQDRFLDEGAVQCGYCSPGMLLSADALLRKNPNANENEIRDALAGNLCRCTGYVKPIKAVQK